MNQYTISQSDLDLSMGSAYGTIAYDYCNGTFYPTEYCSSWSYDRTTCLSHPGCQYGCTGAGDCSVFSYWLYEDTCQTHPGCISEVNCIFYDYYLGHWYCYDYMNICLGTFDCSYYSDYEHCTNDPEAYWTTGCTWNGCYPDPIVECRYIDKTLEIGKGCHYQEHCAQPEECMGRADGVGPCYPPGYTGTVPIDSPLCYTLTPLECPYDFDPAYSPYCTKENCSNFYTTGLECDLVNGCNFVGPYEYVSNGTDISVNIYAFRDFPCGKKFSAPASVTVQDTRAGETYYLTWQWDPATKADGYRIVKEVEGVSYFIDVDNNTLSYVDNSMISWTVGGVTQECNYVANDVWGIGIYAVNKSNVYIRNGTLEGFMEDIHLENITSSSEVLTSDTLLFSNMHFGSMFNISGGSLVLSSSEISSFGNFSFTDVELIIYNNGDYLKFQEPVTLSGDNLHDFVWIDGDRIYVNGYENGLQGVSVIGLINQFDKMYQHIIGYRIEGDNEVPILDGEYLGDNMRLSYSSLEYEFDDGLNGEIKFKPVCGDGEVQELTIYDWSRNYPSILSNEYDEECDPKPEYDTLPEYDTFEENHCIQSGEIEECQCQWIDGYKLVHNECKFPDDLEYDEDCTYPDGQFSSDYNFGDGFQPNSHWFWEGVRQKYASLSEMSDESLYSKFRFSDCVPEMDCPQDEFCYCGGSDCEYCTCGDGFPTCDVSLRVEDGNIPDSAKVICEVSGSDGESPYTEVYAFMNTTEFGWSDGPLQDSAILTCSDYQHTFKTGHFDVSIIPHYSGIVREFYCYLSLTSYDGDFNDCEEKIWEFDYDRIPMIAGIFTYCLNMTTGEPCSDIDDWPYDDNDGFSWWYPPGYGNCPTDFDEVKAMQDSADCNSYYRMCAYCLRDRDSLLRSGLVYAYLLDTGFSYPYINFNISIEIIGHNYLNAAEFSAPNLRGCENARCDMMPLEASTYSCYYPPDCNSENLEVDIDGISIPLILSGPINDFCGNKIVLSPEECDDANIDVNDTCISCLDAECGDGYLLQGVEQCDDGNANNGDGCENSCTITNYYDGIYSNTTGISENAETPTITTYYPNKAISDNISISIQEYKLDFMYLTSYYIANSNVVETNCSDYFVNKAENTFCNKLNETYAVCDIYLSEMFNYFDKPMAFYACAKLNDTWLNLSAPEFLVVSTSCGDGKVSGDPLEDCDDGNTKDGDECPSTCFFSSGECGNVDECEVGTFTPADDTPDEYKWNCTGTDSIPIECKSPSHGECGKGDNSCINGTAVEQEDNDTHYLWGCNGGDNSLVLCSSLIPGGPGTFAVRTIGLSEDIASPFTTTYQDGRIIYDNITLMSSNDYSISDDYYLADYRNDGVDCSDSKEFEAIGSSCIKMNGSLVLCTITLDGNFAESNFDQELEYFGCIKDNYTYWHKSPAEYLMVETSCGDGKISNTEECDDGGTINGDGCTYDCKKECILQGVSFSLSSDLAKDKDGDGKADMGDLVDMSATVIGYCSEANHLQIDASGSQCDLSFTGGNMTGIFSSGFSILSYTSGMSISGIWTVPSISPACVDVTVSGDGSALWENNPNDPEPIAYQASVSGDITFDGISQRCGDSNTDTNEECDDGNNNNYDACLNNCSSARCGDGYLQTGTEQCDDGYTDNGDGCSSDCDIEQPCIITSMTITLIDDNVDGLANLNEYVSINAAITGDCSQATHLQVDANGEGCDIGYLLLDGIDISGIFESNKDIAIGEDYVSGLWDITDIPEETCAGKTVTATAGALWQGIPEAGRYPIASIDASGSFKFAHVTTPPRCGDNNLDPFDDEECDDGNLINEDGCSADCKKECILKDVSFSLPIDPIKDIDGDGKADQGDKVDFSATVIGYCSETHHLQIDALGGDCKISFNDGDMVGMYLTGLYLNELISLPGTPISGTWLVPSIHSDCIGKTVEGDGSALWENDPTPDQIPFTYQETVLGSLEFDGLLPDCGDNNIDPGEECDDGNTANGDSCSSNCEWVINIRTAWSEDPNSPEVVDVGTNEFINKQNIISCDGSQGGAGCHDHDGWTAFIATNIGCEAAAVEGEDKFSCLYSNERYLCSVKIPAYFESDMSYYGCIDKGNGNIFESPEENKEYVHAIGCGDGIVQDPEACDSSDHCTLSCTCEADYIGESGICIRDECTISSMYIDLFGDINGNRLADVGDDIIISASFSGDCSQANHIQVDARGEGCEIEYVPAEGIGLSGIYDSVSIASDATSVEGFWRVGSIPPACANKYVEATAGALWNGVPTSGLRIAYFDDPNGGFRFAGPAEPVCGDGALGADEECDPEDGNFEAAYCNRPEHANHCECTYGFNEVTRTCTPPVSTFSVHTTGLSEYSETCPSGYQDYNSNCLEESTKRTYLEALAGIRDDILVINSPSSIEEAYIGDYTVPSTGCGDYSNLVSSCSIVGNTAECSIQFDISTSPLSPEFFDTDLSYYGCVKIGGDWHESTKELLNITTSCGDGVVSGNEECEYDYQIFCSVPGPGCISAFCIDPGRDGSCTLDPDVDDDTVPNEDELEDPVTPLDTDNDGNPDYNDPDDDGDSVLTIYEDLDGNNDPQDDDTDGDSIHDYLDSDDDNDGIPTIVEHPDPNQDGNPQDAWDIDGDIIPDYLDPDTDNFCGDGYTTGNEQCDDANFDNRDYCLNNCSIARCGDNFTRLGYENCDEGFLNGMDGHCRADCYVLQDQGRLEEELVYTHTSYSEGAWKSKDPRYDKKVKFFLNVSDSRNVSGVFNPMTPESNDNYYLSPDNCLYSITPGTSCIQLWHVKTDLVDDKEIYDLPRDIAADIAILGEPVIPLSMFVKYTTPYNKYTTTPTFYIKIIPQEELQGPRGDGVLIGPTPLDNQEWRYDNNMPYPISGMELMSYVGVWKCAEGYTPDEERMICIPN